MKDEDIIISQIPPQYRGDYLKVLEGKRLREISRNTIGLEFKHVSDDWDVCPISNFKCNGTNSEFACYGARDKRIFEERCSKDYYNCGILKYLKIEGFFRQA